MSDKNISQPVVFIGYSHKDETEKDTLLTHWSVLQQSGPIDLWSDDDIGPGKDREQEISQAIGQATVAILLISANFLTSDILNRQLPQLLERYKNEELTIFPVIAKFCAWQSVPWLAKMQVRPKSGRPVWGEGGSHADEDLTTIAKEVAEIITPPDARDNLSRIDETVDKKRQEQIKPTNGIIITETLDTKILLILLAYFQQHPGDPKMNLNKLIEAMDAKQVNVMQCLYGLREKQWLSYDLTDKAESGLVWLTQLGIRVAKGVQRD